MKYIESTPLPDGTYDHSEVIEAHKNGAKIDFLQPLNYWENLHDPKFIVDFKYRAQAPETYSIHESSSTLREVKGDAGPAVAEMLLDRIKELESTLDSIRIYGSDTLSGPVTYIENESEWLKDGIREMVSRARAALNKDPK